MIVKGALSPSQMERGRRYYNTFNLINGMSYICLGEMVIILFAIKLGSPDFCIAALGSFFYLSYFCMPLGKVFMARAGAAKVIAYCWTMRNASALTVAMAPLLTLIHPYAGIASIMTGAFGFYACRSTGLIGCQPLMGDITTADNRGKFTSSNYRIFNISALLMLGVIILLMNLSRSVWLFDCIIVAGAILGFISAWFVGKVDETESIRESAKKPILEDVMLSLRNSTRFKQILANCVINSALALTVPISMLAVKRCYGVSDGDALVFALIQFAGGIATSYVVGLLAEETGPRPLAILFYCSSILLCVLWAASPEVFKWQYAALPFVLAGAASMGTGIAMTQYFLISVPSKERVAASLTIFVISGVAAGVVGVVFGGGLLKWLGSLNMSQHELFQIYFAVVGALLACCIPLVAKLEPKSDWNVGEVLSLAFAPKDLIALFNLYSIEKVSTPERESADIERLLEIKSGLSERALISYLDSPRFSMRGRALSALGEIPFGEQAERAILKELEDGEHTTAHIAAQIAGERRLKEAIPLLRKRLDSDDYYLQGKCMLSLAQLGDSESFGRIKELMKKADNPRTTIYGAASLALIGDDESFKILLEKSLEKSLPSKARYEVVYSMADLAGSGDEVYRFLKRYGKDKQAALLELSETAPASIDPKKLSGEALRAKLVEIFEKSSSRKMASVAEILKSPEAQEMPEELLLCLLPLAAKA